MEDQGAFSQQSHHQFPGMQQVVNSTPKPKSLNDIDFSKPEKHLKEIIEFMKSVTILQDDKNILKNLKTINGQQSQFIIYNLIKIFAPNYQSMPKFEEQEIVNLFK